MSFPIAKPSLDENSAEFENCPLIKPTGFREYDARWILGSELNLMGLQALGMGLGTLLHELGVERHIVVGHDYRSYSTSVKMAVVSGLLASGCKVVDIGLSVSPMAYFAQFALDVPAVAMITASHNENGWTGVKMGADRPKTFGPDEMGRLKEIVLGGHFDLTTGGSYSYVENFAEAYIKELTDHAPYKRKMKAVVATGNGTAGLFAPRVLSDLGVDVIELDTALDHSFPNYNPNPEDMVMLRAVKEAVLSNKADIGLAFDGDGDRCGVIGDDGEPLFADKVGVMLARDLSKKYDNAQFVVDVKSTGLFATDPVLKAQNAKTDYWKTGHSYIKRRVSDLDALAGFEKSGHFFFNDPIGRGYDDGIVAAIAVLDMLESNPDASFSELSASLPLTYQSPTMSPHCDDEIKYGVVDKIVAKLLELQTQGVKFAGQAIMDVITVNGARIIVEDGTWALVRASSNKPELVVVVESPISDARMRAIFSDLDALIREHREVGAYNQTLD